ncbi:hypothetical protein [Bdellovibrio sp. BCCA]|uniref:hypothetical protein n=1 Tax=Bdellovibrio sp. BCCA TaxID=3136281 RepID=UPI0030F36DEF
MKIVITSLAFLFTLPAFAAPVSRCVGTTQTHQLVVEQTGSDTQVTLEDINLHRYQDLKDPKEGVFKISGKEKSIIVIENKTVDDFSKARRISQELVVSLMMGRPEFQGEEDMLYAYASDIIHTLVCK